MTLRSPIHRSAKRQALTALACIALVLSSTAASATSDSNRAAALSYVRGKCLGKETHVDTSMWLSGVRFNALFGNCRATDGHDQHIWFFDRGRFIGTDARHSSREIFGMWRDDKMMAFMYVLYRRQDPMCCPMGGGKIVRFRWDGAHVRALDRIPPVGLR